MFHRKPSSSLRTKNILQNPRPRATSEQVFVQKIKQLIQANFANEQFDVASLARQVHLSVSQLNRRLNAAISQPAGQLISSMKMAYAAHLLLHTGYSISQISGAVGYWNQAHFCRSFKKRYGCAPSRFRETQGKVARAQNG